jgi:hypothetical protein
LLACRGPPRCDPSSRGVQLDSKHAHRLDRIIIWLIVIEVFIEVRAPAHCAPFPDDDQARAGAQVFWNILIVDVLQLYPNKLKGK